MKSSRTRADLFVIGINSDTSQFEVDLRIAHLAWLEKRAVLDDMLQLSSLELEDQTEELAESELTRRREIIDRAKISVMRLADGSLSTPFLQWYGTFCGYEGGSAIHYSPAAIERGDHPYFDQEVGANQLLDIDVVPPLEEIPPSAPDLDQEAGANQLLDIDVVPPLEEVPPPAPIARGGTPGRRMAHNIVIEAVIDHILQSNPLITPAEAWLRFFDIAPDWQHILTANDNLTHVEFEQIHPRHGRPYLELRSVTSQNNRRTRDYSEATFQQRLRDQRTARG